MVSRLQKLEGQVAGAIGSKLEALQGDKLSTFRRDTAAWLDRAFLKLAHALDADLLIECGAHEAGASIQFVKQRGHRALAIEANPFTFERLTRKAERNGVEVVRVGLGDKEGRATFYVREGAERSGNTSFLKIASVEYDEIEVRVTTLDAIANAKARDASAVALWVDVEGLAYQVLLGGSALLGSSRCKLIKVEVETKAKWEGQSLAEDVDKLLEGFGLTPVLQDVEYETQHNLIYVRRESLDSLEPILRAEWPRLASIRPRIFPKSAKGVARDAKIWLTSGDRTPLFLHRIFAALGSASSEYVVRKRTEGKRGG